MTKEIQKGKRVAKHITLNISEYKLDLSTPKVMGIINLTADSFYDGGKIKSDKDLLRKTERMIEEGVDILDVGAYSSRPGATDIAADQESKNATSGIDLILKNFPKQAISLDTFRASVAEKGLNHGASIINDISGGALDPAMFPVIATHKVPYIMMHMRGNPQTMVSLTDYNELLSDIIAYFKEKTKALSALGAKDIIIDPGFGFAKNREQNFELLNRLEELKTLGLPMLCGVSRKSMIFKSLGFGPDQALNGTTALNMACLMKGASILRVHDVKEAKETIHLYKEMNKR